MASVILLRIILSSRFNYDTTILTLTFDNMTYLMEYILRTEYLVSKNTGNCQAEGAVKLSTYQMG